MKFVVYTHNHKYGFFVHNNKLNGYVILFDSGAIYDSYTLAQMAGETNIS